MIDESLSKAFESVTTQLKNSRVLSVTQSFESQNQDFIKNNITQYLKKAGDSLTDQQTKRLQDEFFSFGPIESLLADEEITEIIINNPRSIWYELNGSFHKHKDLFYSKLTYNNFTHKICQLAGLKLNLETPCVNGQWNNFRIHLVQPPLVKNYTNITMRRHPSNPWDFNKLINESWAPENEAFKLLDYLNEKKNLLIIGPTGSGKTSVLNALLQNVDPEERVICIEDTSEISLPNKISTKLLTRSDSQTSFRDYSQTDLLKEALRMRPERLIMGEIRGAEAKDFILTLSTGHAGSIATLHASSPHQALWRLELLVQLGAPYWNLESIRGLIKLSVDYIIQVGIVNKKRQLLGVYKVASLEKNGFTIEPVFKL